METIETKAHPYNQAKQDIKKYEKAVTLKEVKAFCLANPESDDCPMLDSWHSHCPELDLTPTYNDEVVKATCEKLGLEKEGRTDKTIGELVYTTRNYNRALKTVEMYETMTANGLIPVQDTTPEMHLKKARLIGESTGLMGVTKYDENVKVIHDGEYVGYQKPRQRTKFYRPAIDSQLFLQLL